VKRIIMSLESAVPGSVVLLRGSLAGGYADAYSDIDILWEVPDGTFLDASERIGEILAQAQAVESLRSVPDFQQSDRRRLFFVQFEHMPLFWRADINVVARSVHMDPHYDIDNDAARGDDWSLTHSALMNAIAAVKALLRGKDDLAEGLLARGFVRIGLAIPEGHPQEQILILAQGATRLDPSLAALAGEIILLHREAFGTGESSGPG
jgi:hypothetical protein